MTESLDLVKDQYERHPYPPPSWLAGFDPAGSCHASFETGSSLVRGFYENHDGKRIGLIGCGTFEPFIFGSLHPKAQVVGVDLSKKSVVLAKRKCALHGLQNVKFLVGDFLNLGSQDPELQYDYIHCYGVLHHLKEPRHGFIALSRLLKDNGFARIMVYSEAQRSRTTLVRQALKSLGLNARESQADIKARSLLRALPLSHPLKLSQLGNSELKSSSGVIDSLLHERENPMNLATLLGHLKASDLKIHRWDFSKNLRNLLIDARGLTLLDKLSFLESFDQWPGPYTLWVAKSDPIEKSPLFYKTHPSFRQPLKSSYKSAVLRSKITLTPFQRQALFLGLQEPIPFDTRLRELIDARFLLGVP